MRFFSSRGGERHAPRGVRRRAARFSPPSIESLEDRQLLAAGALGLNVEIGAFQSFVNLLQTPQRWTAAPGESNTIVLNSSGDPESDANLLFDERVNQSFNGPDPNAVGPNLSGTYHLSFNGQATIEPEYQGFSTPFAVQDQVYNASTNTTTADLVVPSPNPSEFFGITFLNTQATATSAVGTGFSNARLIRPGYAADSTQLYSNEFLSALAPYSVLRYLDPENTNGQPFYNGGTALVTVDAPQVDQTGMPWEYLIALANATNTDMWVNVPQGATNAYVVAMANIFKNGGTVDGVAYPGLNSNLKIYLEYSNEVWGGIPYNEYYQEAAVQNQASNQPLATFPSNLHVYDNVDGTTSTDYNQAVGRRYLERTNDIGQIFQSVLGADPTHQRIRPVLGWQENNYSFYMPTLQWFQHFFGPASAAFYGLGDATYMVATGYSSVTSILNSLTAQESTTAIPSADYYTALATLFGLKNVAYEGGPQIVGDGTTAGDENAEAASRDPRIEQIVAQHYENYFAAGGTLAMYYSGPFGIWSPHYEWTDAELSQYGDPTASPKYRATVDVANASPVAVTAGAQVPAAGSVSFPATTDSLGENFVNPATGQQAYWLLNVASAGTYDLRVATNAFVGSAPGQVEILINGNQVGSAMSVASGTVVDLGNLVLPAGLSTLSLYVVHGFNDPGQSNKDYYQFQPTTFTLAAAATPPPILDPGFEAVAVGGGYAYDPTGSAWKFSSPSGVSGNGSAFTSGNPAAPQGSQVAFLQQTGSFSQSVSGWAAGSYTISFDAAQRGNYGKAEDFEVLVDGQVVGTFKPSGTSYASFTTSAFTVSAGSHVVEFLGLDSAGGDNTALVDAVSAAIISPSALPSVGDGGFESFNVGASFAYNPAGSAWTFTGQSGVSGNYSAFTNGNSVSPQGQQVAFIQDHGSFSQTISGWSAGTYAISFEASQRGDYGKSVEDFEVLVDGQVVGTFKPSGTSYASFTTSAFTVSAGSHVVEFLGLDSAGTESSAFIDAVSVVSAVSPQALPPAGDPGFEKVHEAGTYAYDPTGSSWAFSGNAGVSGNKTAFTSGNPAAPQGSQVAFLQQTGSFSQSVTGWSAGIYTIYFDAAQRGTGNKSAQNFEVLVDGAIVGTIKPSGSSYQAYATSAFTVSAGSHVIEFLGVDSAGGDNTAFVDSVSIGLN